MSERGHELSPGPRRRLRSPGPLPEASAAAMAHSPVQAGLPGMQVKGGRGPKWRRVGSMGCEWGGVGSRHPREQGVLCRQRALCLLGPSLRSRRFAGSTQGDASRCLFLPLF